MIILLHADQNIRDAFPAAHEAETVVEARALLAERDAPMAVVVHGPGGDASEALDLATDLRGPDPGARVLLVTGRVTAGLLTAALRAGVADVLKPDDDLAEAVGRLADTPAVPAATPAASGKVLCVFSTKGGAGKSVVASNLGLLLAPRVVTLLDLDLDSGDLGVMLRLKPKRSVVDAVAQLDVLSPAGLGEHLVRHRSGAELLAAPPEPGIGDKVTAEDVRRLVGVCRHRSAWTVVDTPAAFTEPVLGAIDVADTVLLVTVPEIPALRSCKQALETLDLLEIPEERVRLVLNRADERTGISPRDAARALGRDFDAEIPSSLDVPRSVNRGVPLVAERGDSPAGLALRTLAATITGEEPPNRRPRPRMPWRRETT